MPRIIAYVTSEVGLTNGRGCAVDCIAVVIAVCTGGCVLAVVFAQDSPVPEGSDNKNYKPRYFDGTDMRQVTSHNQQRAEAARSQWPRETMVTERRPQDQNIGY